MKQKGQGREQGVHVSSVQITSLGHHYRVFSAFQIETLNFSLQMSKRPQAKMQKTKMQKTKKNSEK